MEKLNELELALAAAAQRLTRARRDSEFLAIELDEAERSFRKAQADLAECKGNSCRTIQTN